MWLREKKLKLKSLIGFVSASKIDNYNGGVGGGVEKKFQKNLQNKLKNKNNCCQSPFSGL